MTPSNDRHFHLKQLIAMVPHLCRVQGLQTIRMIILYNNRHLLKSKTWITLFLTRGGGGVSESMDGRGCAILALELVPKNLIFT